MFALTTQRTAAPVATLVAIKAMSCSDGDWIGVVRRCVSEVLAANGVEPERIWAAAPSGSAGDAGAAEHDVLADLLPERRCWRR
jgi:3-oxoacyl-[acyl-carrier-protein] synthase II